MVLSPSKFGSQINIKNNDNPTIVHPSKHVASSCKGSSSDGPKSRNKKAQKENAPESDTHPSAKRKMTNCDDKNDAGMTVKKAKKDPKIKVAAAIPVAPPAEGGVETMCEESKKKRNNNPGLRVINGKVRFRYSYHFSKCPCALLITPLSILTRTPSLASLINL